MTELRSCPFCGNTELRIRAVTDNQPPTPREEWTWYGLIDCCNEHGTHLSFQSHDHFKTEDMAIADVVRAWNVRRGEPMKCCTNCKHWEDYWGDKGSDADEDFGLGDCGHFKQPTGYDEYCAYWEMR